MSEPKVTIEGSIEKETLDRLRWLASRDGVSIGVAIDRAVANTADLASVVESGGSVITEKTPGQLRKVTPK